MPHVYITNGSQGGPPANDAGQDSLPDVADNSGEGRIVEIFALVHGGGGAGSENGGGNEGAPGAGGGGDFRSRIRGRCAGKLLSGRYAALRRRPPDARLERHEASGPMVAMVSPDAGQHRPRRAARGRVRRHAIRGRGRRHRSAPPCVRTAGSGR